MLLKAYPVAPNTTKTGDSVVVIEGPFRGYCGYLQSYEGQGYAKVTVFNAQSKPITIPIYTDNLANVNLVTVEIAGDPK